MAAASSSSPLQPSQPYVPFLEQDNSPFFFKLPLEIREIIYFHYIFGDFGRIHLLESDLDYEGGFKFNPCKGPLRKRGGPFGGYYDDPECCRLGGAYETDLLSLPRTCKRIYTEVIDPLFIIPSFEMDDTVFLRMKEGFASKRFEQITRLSIDKTFCIEFFDLDFADTDLNGHFAALFSGHAKRVDELRDWEGMCEALQRMKGLKECQLWIAHRRTDKLIANHREKVILEPLVKLKWIEYLSVMFRWRGVREEVREELKALYDFDFSWHVMRLLR